MHIFCFKKNSLCSYFEYTVFHSIIYENSFQLIDQYDFKKFENIIIVLYFRIPATAQPYELAQQGYQAAKSELDVNCTRMGKFYHLQVSKVLCTNSRGHPVYFTTW